MRAGAGGAPFLIKLGGAARRDLALSAGLLVLLIPATAVFLPFYVPLAMAHPTLRALSYEGSSVFAIGLPLLTTMLLLLAVGVALRAGAPRFAPSLARLGGPVSTIALVVIIVAMFVANAPEVVRVVRTGAIGAGVLLVLGAFVMGYFLTLRGRRGVLGLGTAQRNVAAAMVVASRDFDDPDILVMVTACSLAGLLVLFPIAWVLARRPPHVGPPTPDSSDPGRPTIEPPFPEPA